MPRPNRGKYLEQNARGVWEIRWTEAGRSRRLSTGQEDFRKAQRVLASVILDEGGQAPGPVREAPTVNKVLDWYEIDRVRNNQFSAETLRWHLRVLRQHFGPILASEITQGDIDDFTRDRGLGLLTYQTEDGVTRGGPVNPGTIRANLQMLSTAFNHALKTRRIEAREMPYFKLPPASPARNRWLTREEAARLLDAAQPDPEARLTNAYRFITMGLFTATRRAVICALPWDRINIDGRTIDFQDPNRPRTKKRTGVIPITDEFLPIVKRAYDERISDWWLDTPKFPSRAFDKACARANLPDIHPHALRHTWATWAMQDGMDIWAVAGVLHDTIATVEKTYAHQSTEHLREAMNRRLLTPRIIDSTTSTPPRAGQEMQENRSPDGASVGA